MVGCGNRPTVAIVDPSLGRIVDQPPSLTKIMDLSLDVARTFYVPNVFTKVFSLKLERLTSRYTYIKLHQTAVGARRWWGHFYPV